MKPVHMFLLVFVLLLRCDDDNIDSPKWIIGKWQLFKSCGGFTGVCWYPDEDHQEIAIFTANNKYFKYFNGDKIFDYNYELGTIREEDGVKYFEIRFIPSEGTTGFHEWSTEFWFTDDNYLNFLNSEFIDEFERIR